MKVLKWLKTGSRILALMLLLFIVLGFSGKSSLADETEEKIRTVDSRAILTGQEEPGTRIDVTVYNYPGGRSRATLYHTRFTVGESGIYQLTIPLPVMGEQYVQVSIENVLSTIIYERYPAELGEELRSYYLNIFEYLNENSP